MYKMAGLPGERINMSKVPFRQVSEEDFLWYRSLLSKGDMTARAFKEKTGRDYTVYKFVEAAKTFTEYRKLVKERTQHYKNAKKPAKPVAQQLPAQPKENPSQTQGSLFESMTPEEMTQVVTSLSEAIVPVFTALTEAVRGLSKAVYALHRDLEKGDTPANIPADQKPADTLTGEEPAQDEVTN